MKPDLLHYLDLSWNCSCPSSLLLGACVKGHVIQVTHNCEVSGQHADLTQDKLT